jgi:hypothetical protein
MFRRRFLATVSSTSRGPSSHIFPRTRCSAISGIWFSCGLIQPVCVPSFGMRHLSRALLGSLTSTAH